MKDSRENILLTSLALFLRKGFKEVTMKDIVDNTGMSKGAFYHYFSSKEQVFSEVIDHFFTARMDIDYSEFPQDSLSGFYTGILRHFEAGRAAITRMIHTNGSTAFSSNYYYLIFDAMRILPDFKEQHKLQQKDELNAWKKIISVAKKNEEISTQLPDEQLARLFIYLGDGLNLNLVLNEDVNKKKNELKGLWDALYQTLK